MGRGRNFVCCLFLTVGRLMSTVINTMVSFKVGSLSHVILELGLQVVVLFCLQIIQHLNRVLLQYYPPKSWLVMLGYLLSCNCIPQPVPCNLQTVILPFYHFLLLYHHPHRCHQHHLYLFRFLIYLFHLCYHYHKLFNIFLLLSPI
jgi:hypothetical protein